MKKTGFRQRIKRVLPFYRVVFIASLLASAALVAAITVNDVSHSKHEAKRVSQVYSVRVESLLNSLFHKTDVLEAIVISARGSLSAATFNDVAKSLSDAPGIRAIQYVPNGVVEYVYPLEGNEATQGSNLFDNPIRRDDALLARDTKQITLSGPYELTQGGLGLVARNPVFLSNSQGEEEFWGFITIVLELPAALDPILLSDLEKSGYSYRLWVPGESFNEPRNSGDSTIVESGSFDMSDAIDYPIAVPNLTWVFSIMPTAGWIIWSQVIIGLAIGLVIGLLLAAVVRQSQIRRCYLQEMLTTDELTGLHNRRWFSEKIERWCAGSGGKVFSILFLDLDDFKLANDTMGHKYGDELLVHVARLLEKACENESVPVRLAGDEFVIMLPDTTREEAKVFVAKLHDLFETPFELDGKKWCVSLSAGIAAYPSDGVDYDSLIRVADDRMYAEKRTRCDGQ